MFSAETIEAILTKLIGSFIMETYVVQLAYETCAPAAHYRNLVKVFSTFKNVLLLNSPSLIDCT